MTAITLDATYAPELAEFWCQKYKETKEELEKLKVNKDKFLPLSPQKLIQCVEFQ